MPSLAASSANWRWRSLHLQRRLHAALLGDVVRDAERPNLPAIGADNELRLRADPVDAVGQHQAVHRLEGEFFANRTIPLRLMPLAVLRVDQGEDIIEVVRPVAPPKQVCGVD